ncbi:toll/interleukin-1 receptor domain-containing protein [Vibrio cyclitrophicus]
MTKICLSYVQDVKLEVEKVKGVLVDLEYEVLDLINDILPGDDISASIESMMEESDVIVHFVSEGSLASKWFNRELSLSEAFSKRVIPVICHPNIELPKQLEDKLALRLDFMDPVQIANEIDRASTKYRVKDKIDTEIKIETTQRVERNISEYISVSIKDLSKKENSFKCQAYFWYAVGYIALLSGVGAGVYKATKMSMGKVELLALIQFLLLSSVILGLLVALSKYAFTLGKSCMVESLRNSDRAHAISFGDFYLKAFPNDLEWDKVKEVFQHWNIDKGSSFSEQSPESFDPKILAAAIEISKHLSGSKGSKK